MHTNVEEMKYMIFRGVNCFPYTRTLFHSLSLSPYFIPPLYKHQRHYTRLLHNLLTLFFPLLFMNRYKSNVSKNIERKGKKKKQFKEKEIKNFTYIFIYVCSKFFITAFVIPLNPNSVIFILQSNDYNNSCLRFSLNISQ